MPLPLRTEWRTASDVSPLAVTESSVELALPYTPKPPAIPADTRGQAHIRRDGSVGHELKDDSELYVGVYGFGAGEFADDRWGLKVRDEMLAANMGVEGGSILHYDPQGGGVIGWLTMTEQMRIANGTALARWPGPWSVPDDDFLGPDALAALMKEPNWEDYVSVWCEWRNTSTEQNPRFVLYKDEVNLAFGGDPTDDSHPFLAKLAPYGGIAKVLEVLRSASGCPIAPGMHGVGPDVPVGYTKWLDPKFADFVVSYNVPNDIPAPWTGQTLRHLTETLKWAAKHGDPNRPLSLNVSLITGREIKQPDGSWKQIATSTDPKTIAAQPWVCLALRATVIRCYALHVFDGFKNDSMPVGFEYQQAVKPGDPEYYALLSSATLIKENADLLLGSDQPLPDAGPDFMCAYRKNAKGNIWFAVNLSETWKTVPIAAVPMDDWSHMEYLWPDGKRTWHSIDDNWTGNIPPNGVLLLTQRN
jgi:hypothetical protein